MKVLAIETSCDDTSVAIVDSHRKTYVCLVADQHKQHEPFGGVVPEIASRNHSYHILNLVESAFAESDLSWNEIDGIAVTSRPGLVGSLIVGLVTAKTLALTKDLPFIGVHHIEGHIAAPFLSDSEHTGADFHRENFLALVVSGGHTSLYNVHGVGDYEILGETLDDAAGEAFDKFAKMLGLPYPGGIHIDRMSAHGDSQAIPFPRPLINDGSFNFSFSGLKAAGQRLLATLDQKQLDERMADLCASYQNAIIEVLTSKVKKAMKKNRLMKLVVTGGVSANSQLRQSMTELCENNDFQLAIPPVRYCTDNAAMIGLAGLWRLEKGEFSPQNLPPKARDSI